MPYPGLLNPEPLAPWQSTDNQYHHRRHSDTVLAQSLWGLWVLVHKVCLSPLSVSDGNGVYSKCEFTPSTVLLGLLLCPWMWCISSHLLQCCTAATPVPTVLLGLLWLLGRKVMTNLDSILKSRDITLPTNKGPSSQGHGFSNGHVWMWELDYKESWEPKNWFFWTVVLEKTLESPLDCKEIQLVHLKGNQSWIFIGRANAKAETSILWPPHVKSWLIWKDPDAGKDWRREEKGTTEDEMVGGHHQRDGREFE